MPVVAMPGSASAQALYAGGPMAGTPTPRQAAREFEAMLIAQLIRAAREADAGREENSLAGSDNYLEFAERHLAEALADSGAFGFARMILENLEPDANSELETANPTRHTSASAGRPGKLGK